MTITRMPPPLRDYIRSFGLVAIARWRDGRLGVCKDPTNADDCWWCRASDAGKILHAAVADSGDPVAAAATLRLQLTAHDVVVQRVRQAVDRIDAVLEQARRTGMLHFFNSTFAMMHSRAKGRGAAFHDVRTSYGKAAQGDRQGRSQWRHVGSVADPVGVQSGPAA
jgi:hypothetical protein